MNEEEHTTLTDLSDTMSSEEKTIIENGLRQGQSISIDPEVKGIAKFENKIEALQKRFKYLDLVILPADNWEELVLDYTEEEINTADYLLIDGTLYQEN